MKKQVTHVIVIRLKTKRGFLTDTLWKRIAVAMGKDKFFTDENFDSIMITGRNSLE